MRTPLLPLASAISLVLSPALLVAQPHGTLSELSAVGSDNLCEHAVPAEVCVLCHPELEARFREVGDWCRGHRVPESQCHRCHPDLSFDPLPPVPDGADYVDITTEQALAGLDALYVPGKVTVVDFWAAWCAPCRNFDVDLRVLAGEDHRVAVRRVDIGGWDGPLVDRYMTDVSELPYVVVLGAEGQELGRIAGVTAASLRALIAPELDRIPPTEATDPAASGP